jgi:hypothetical protein
MKRPLDFALHAPGLTEQQRPLSIKRVYVDAVSSKYLTSIVPRFITLRSGFVCNVQSGMSQRQPSSSSLAPQPFLAGFPNKFHVADPPPSRFHTTKILVYLVFLPVPVLNSRKRLKRMHGKATQADHACCAQTQYSTFHHPFLLN